jgi:general stress protein 26
MATVRESDEISKIWRIARSNRVAVLTLRDEAGRMNARPMLSLIPEGEESVWFITDRNSPKMGEIGRDTEALLTFAAVDAGDYVVFRGCVSAVDDREKLKSLWNKGDELSFPEGPDASAAVLVRFDPSDAEYWTGGSGAIKFAMKYVKMKLTGRRATMGEHGHVSL